MSNTDSYFADLWSQIKYFPVSLYINDPLWDEQLLVHNSLITDASTSFLIASNSILKDFYEQNESTIEDLFDRGSSYKNLIQSIGSLYYFSSDTEVKGRLVNRLEAFADISLYNEFLPGSPLPDELSEEMISTVRGFDFNEIQELLPSQDNLANRLIAGVISLKAPVNEELINREKLNLINAIKDIGIDSEIKEKLINLTGTLATNLESSTHFLSIINQFSKVTIQEDGSRIEPLITAEQAVSLGAFVETLNHRPRLQFYVEQQVENIVSLSGDNADDFLSLYNEMKDNFLVSAYQPRLAEMMPSKETIFGSLKEKLELLIESKIFTFVNPENGHQVAMTWRDARNLFSGDVLFQDIFATDKDGNVLLDQNGNPQPKENSIAASYFYPLFAQRALVADYRDYSGWNAIAERASVITTNTGIATVEQISSLQDYTEGLLESVFHVMYDDKDFSSDSGIAVIRDIMNVLERGGLSNDELLNASHNETINEFISDSSLLDSKLQDAGWSVDEIAAIKENISKQVVLSLFDALEDHQSVNDKPYQYQMPAPAYFEPVIVKAIASLPRIANDPALNTKLSQAVMFTAFDIEALKEIPSKYTAINSSAIGMELAYDKSNTSRNSETVTNWSWLSAERNSWMSPLPIEDLKYAKFKYKDNDPLMLQIIYHYPEQHEHHPNTDITVEYKLFDAAKTGNIDNLNFTDSEGNIFSMKLANSKPTSTFKLPFSNYSLILSSETRAYTETELNEKKDSLILKHPTVHEFDAAVMENATIKPIVFPDIGNEKLAQGIAIYGQDGTLLKQCVYNDVIASGGSTITVQALVGDASLAQTTFNNFVAAVQSDQQETGFLSGAYSYASGFIADAIDMLPAWGWGGKASNTEISR